MMCSRLAPRRSGLRGRWARAALVALLALTAPVVPAGAQELEPRAYVSAPVGANMLTLGLSGSVGPVSFDPSLPIEDVNGKVAGSSVGYARTFALFGRQASVFSGFGYAWGTVSGKVQEAVGQTSRSGLRDGKIKFNLLVHGGPALTPSEFAKSKKATVVGLAVAVIAPVGQYYPQKLINLGSNRWSFKPEVGISYPMRRWMVDLSAGAWFFTANHAFYPGDVALTQHPIFAVQSHLSYNLTLRSWAAIDATWYAGGKPSLNGIPSAVRQNNMRLGATLSLPVGRQSSIRVAYAGPVVSVLGTAFHVVSVGWQYNWLARGGR